MICRFLAWVSRPHMTELGRELYAAFQGDAWLVEEYRVKHKESGIALWDSSGALHMHIDSIPVLKFTDKQYAPVFNWADKWALSHECARVRRKASLLPGEAALNVLRLSKMKGEVK